MSVYTYITAPYRYAEQSDQAVRNAFQLARTLELNTPLTNLSDATDISQTIFGILKAPRVRFEVPVIGINIVTLSMYDGTIPFPCATLLSDRFGLTGAGRIVLIPEFTINLDKGQTVLRCWG